MSSKEIKNHPLSFTGSGCEKYVVSETYGPETCQRKAYIQAGLHADETPGYLVIHHLARLLDQAEAEGRILERVVLVPAANPIGLNQWTHDRLDGRFDNFSGVNFNRDFPDLVDLVSNRIKEQLTQDSYENIKIIRGAIRKVLCELHPVDESDCLKKMLFSLAYDSDLVLDLHCDARAVFHIYSGTPLQEEMIKLSERLESQLCLLADDSGVNPFDEACGKIWWNLKKKFPGHPIPLTCTAATIELRGQADVSHDVCRQDAENIFHYLMDENFIDGEAPPVQGQKADYLPLSGVEYLYADAFGVVVFHHSIGDFVQTGDIIAEIIQMNTADSKQKVSILKASTDGIVFTLISDRMAKPGKLLAKISGTKPIKPEGKALLTP